MYEVSLEELHRQLKELDTLEAQLLHFRFWECLSIEEIALVTRLTWEEVDSRIEKSIKLLRERLVGKNITCTKPAA